MPLARGIAETFTTVTDVKLTNSRTGGYSGLSDNLRLQAERANDDEVIIPFIKYDESGPLSLANAKEMVRLQTNYGDILTVPLQTELTYGADNGDGLDSETVGTLVENTHTYLKAVEELEIGKPVMGIFPSISKEVTDYLFELYLNHEIRAFCVDFNRRTATAKAQEEQVIRPLMRSLLADGLNKKSFIYAVNLVDGKAKDDGRRPAEQIYAYTLGFDAVGDVHLPPRLPPEVFEEMEEPSGIRLFDDSACSFRQVPLSDVDNYLSSKSQFTPTEVKRRIKANSDESYRLRSLINAELISYLLGLLEEEDGQAELFEVLTEIPQAVEDDLSQIEEIVERITDD